jgi:hypothetical protein
MGRHEDNYEFSEDAVRIPINKSICGHDVYLLDEHRHVRFGLLIEEGNEVHRESFAELKTYVDGWYERKQKEDKKKFEPLPLTVFTDDEDILKGQKYGGRHRGEYSFVDAKVTGVHAGTGHPILKIGSGRAQQHSGYSYVNLLVPLSDEAKEELLTKQKAKKAAEKAYSLALDSFRISSLKDWVKSKGEEGLCSVDEEDYDE